EGSTVLLSGVVIGEVTSVSLLPDDNVEVICTIAAGNPIYRHSVFAATSTLTGSTTLAITLPPHRSRGDILPQTVLPEDQQPWGTLPPTIADLVSSGQEQLRSFSKTMKVVNAELPALARRFNLVAEHTDLLVLHTDDTLTALGSELDETVAALDRTVSVSGRNLTQLTGNVNGLVTDNRSRLQLLIRNLSDTADNLNKTMAGVAAIASDPMLHASLVQTAQNMADATARLKAIAANIQSITGDPQTEAQLKSAIGNLDAASAKANDLLGRFSHASGASTGTASPAPGGSPSAQSGGTQSNSGIFGQPLVEAHVRETWGDHGGGPASDLNVDLLPGARAHVTVGANDLGYSTTYDLLLDESASPEFQLGGGVLYSKLGVAALFRPFGGPVGVDARLYDPKHPTLDLYGDLRLSQRLQLFYGERSIWGPASRLPSFGLQVNY
ncbi:MAG TPA: hypothetical protein VEJ20_05580, partial [Candidatus Eremiobacteraceae bacterium]|nr:hypothetical protein [Candidatus Eremiobacteraceae bacterium]